MKVLQVIEQAFRTTTDGVPVFAVQEDLDERGLGGLRLQAGVKPVASAAVVDIYEQADQVWHW